MRPRNRAAAAGLVGLTAVWAACVFAEARQKPLWFDEIFTIWLARRSPREILGALRLDSGPPLYYFLAKPFVALGSGVGDDRMVRLLSALAITSLFVLATRRRAAAGGTYLVLLATSPLLFFYSAEGRAYAMLALLSFILFVASTRMRENARAFAIATAASAGVIGLHYIGVFIVGGTILAALMSGRRRTAAASLAGALATTVWLPAALAQPAASMAWSDERLGPALARTLGQFGFWSQPPGYFSPSILPIPAAGTLIGVAIIALVAIAVARRRRLLPAAVFVAFPLAACAVSSGWRPIYFAGRTEMAVWPAALWLVARASRRSALLRALLPVVALAGAVSIALALARPARPAPYVEDAGLVMRLRPAPALVAAADADYLPLRLAADRGQLGSPVLCLPGELEFHPGWFLPLSPGEAARAADVLAERLRNRPLSSTAAILLPSDPVLARAVSEILKTPVSPASRISVQGRLLLITK